MLTIIVPVYNGEGHIREILTRLLRSSEPEWEILVGDDASTDGTRSILNEFSDPRIQTFFADSNIGAGALRNELLRRAKGQYIAMQDADDSFVSERFSKQLQFLKTHPDVDVVGSGCILEEAGKTWGHLTPPAHPGKWDWLLKRAVVHASIMFRKRDLIGKAQYHEGLRFGEDYYFLFQLQHLGAHFQNIEEPLYIYRISQEELKNRAARYWKSLLKTDWELSKLFSFFNRFLYLSLNMAKLAIQYLRFCINR